MDEGDNSSRMDDTDSSDITFYSAASSPDVSWESFTIPKVTHPTAQSNRTSVTCESGFDWLETFFDPAVCDLDSVFEDIEPTVIGTDSTLTEPGTECTKKLKQARLEDNNQWLERPTTPIELSEFNSIFINPGLSMNPFEGAVEEGIVDERIRTGSWNLSNSCTDDNPDYQLFDDGPSFLTNGSTISDLESTLLESSLFSEDLPRQNSNDLTRESESEHTLVPTLDTLELSYISDVRCVDSSGIETVIQKDIFSGSNERVSSVSRDENFGEVGPELGDNISINSVLKETEADDQPNFFCHLLTKGSVSSTDNLVTDSADDSDFDSSNQEFKTANDRKFNCQASGNNQIIDISSKNEKTTEISNKSTLKDKVMSAGIKPTLQTFHLIRPNLKEGKNYHEKHDSTNTRKVVEPCLIETSFGMLKNSFSLCPLEMINVSEENNTPCEQNLTESVKVRTEKSSCRLQNLYSRNSSRLEKSPDVTKGLSSQFINYTDKVTSVNSVVEDSLNDNTELANIENSLSASIMENSFFDFQNISPVISDSFETAERTTSDLLCSTTFKDATVTESGRLNNLNSLINNREINTVNIDAPSDKNNDLDTRFSSVVGDQTFNTEDNQNTQTTSEATITKVRRLHNFKHSDNLDGTALIMTSADTSKNLTRIEASDIKEKNSDISFDFCVKLTEPESTKTETPLVKSDTSSVPTQTNSAVSMVSCDVTESLSETSLFQEKIGPLADKCDCKNFLLPGKAFKMKDRINSVPSGSTACPFLTPLSRSSSLGIFRGDPLKKRPRSSDKCASCFQVESGQMVGKNSLKNSFSESNLVFLLKEIADPLSKQEYSFYNASRKNTKNSKTNEFSRRQTSIQSTITVNKVKEFGYRPETAHINENSSSVKNLAYTSPNVSKKSTYLPNSVELFHTLEDPCLSFLMEPDKITKDSDIENYASGEKSIIKDTYIKSTLKIPDDPQDNSFTCDAKDPDSFFHPNQQKTLVKSDIEISPEYTSYLSGTSFNISQNSSIFTANTIQKVTSSKKRSDPNSQDSRKSIKMKIRSCTDLKGTEYKLIGDDINPEESPLKKLHVPLTGTFLSKKLIFADKNDDSRTLRLTDKNTRIKRSSSLPETLEQLNLADFSLINQSRDRDQFTSLTTAETSLKKCTDPRNQGAERVNSERRTFSANSDSADFLRLKSPSDLSMDSCISLPDISSRPARLSDIDNEPDSPSAVKHDSAMTGRGADTRSVLRPEMSRVPSINAPTEKTSKFSELCDEADNRDSSQCNGAETANLDAPEKMNNCQEEAFRYSPDASFYQRSSRYYDEEPVKVTNTITTQDILKKSVASRGSNDIFTAKTIAIEPPPGKCSFESNWKVQQTVGFVLNENNNLNNNLSTSGVCFETVSVSPNLNLNLEKNEDFPEKLRESFFVSNEDSTNSGQFQITNTRIFDTSRNYDPSTSNQPSVCDSEIADQKHERHPAEIICKHDGNFVLETTDKDKVKETESETYILVETPDELDDNRSLQDLQSEQRLKPTVNVELSEKLILSEFLSNPISNCKQGLSKTKHENFDADKNCSKCEKDLAVLEIGSKRNLSCERDNTMKTTTLASTLSQGLMEGCRVTDCGSNHNNFAKESQEMSTLILGNSECKKISNQRKSRSFPILNAKYNSYCKIERIDLQLNKDGSFGSGDAVQEEKFNDSGINNKPGMNQPSLSRIQSEEAIPVVEPLSIQDLKFKHPLAVTIPVQAEPQCSESQFEPGILELGYTDQATSDEENLNWTVEARTDLGTGRIIPRGKMISIKMPEDYIIASAFNNIQSDEEDTCVVLQPRSVICHQPLKNRSSEGNIPKFFSGQECITGQRAGENNFGRIFCCCCYIQCAGRNETNPAE